LCAFFGLHYGNTMTALIQCLPLHPRQMPGQKCRYIYYKYNMLSQKCCFCYSITRKESVHHNYKHFHITSDISFDHILYQIPPNYLFSTSGWGLYKFFVNGGNFVRSQFCLQRFPLGSFCLPNPFVLFSRPLFQSPVPDAVLFLSVPKRLVAPLKVLQCQRIYFQNNAPCNTVTNIFSYVQN